MTYRHVATIYRPSTSVDSRGQITGTATTLLADVPIEVQQLSGLELVRARKIFAEASYSVKMWADPDTPIKPKDYLTVGTKTLYVGSVVDPELMNRDIELLCKEDIA
jgi:hypothetical protein